MRIRRLGKDTELVGWRQNPDPGILTSKPMLLITTLLTQTISLGDKRVNCRASAVSLSHSARRDSCKLQNPGNLQVIFSPQWQINSLTCSSDRACQLIWHRRPSHHPATVYCREALGQSPGRRSVTTRVIAYSQQRFSPQQSTLDSVFTAQQV